MVKYIEYTKGSKFLQLSTDEQLDLLLHYQNTYENNLPDQIDDATFDNLVKLYEKTSGLKYSVIGAVPSGNKASLPYYLGSLDKIKGESSEDELKKFIKNFPDEKVIEDKIDGNSGLYIVRYIGGELIRKLYTRGNGYVGTDITHLLNYINIPIPEFDIVIRGELVLPLKDFNRININNEFKNARNAGSGVINSKDVNEVLAKHMKFFAYNILDWPYDKINQSYQLMFLEKLGFDIPWNKTIKNITVNILEEILIERRVNAEYDIDGIVIADNSKFYPIEEGRNPKHMIAFKMDVNIITTVKEVIWKPSKDGVLKPVVIYDPVDMSGVTMTRASGKNAKFILNNGVGPGAKIMVTRAGDVIPDIVDVIEPSTQLQLPKENYIWNDNQVEFILKDSLENDTVKKGKIEYFMTQLDIKNVGPGRIALLYDNGFDTLYKILSASVDDFAKIEGLGKKSGQQIYDNIHNVIEYAPLANVMAASGIFGAGFGTKRFETIVSIYPDILDRTMLPKAELTALIRFVPGFDKIAENVAEGLPRFKDWLHEHPMIKLELNEPVFKGDEEVEPGYMPMNDIKVVFTGFRSSELEDKIKSRGGVVSSTITKNTTFLIAKDPSDLKGKGEKAVALKIPIVSLDDFKKSYNL
jgi:NAD-dependent DNA ligase